jgi:hypothetical protein
MLEHSPQTLKADQVPAAFDIDDFNADVLCDAFGADWTYDIWRLYGVWVGEEVGVFGHEGIEARGRKFWGVSHFERVL